MKTTLVALGMLVCGMAFTGCPSYQSGEEMPPLDLTPTPLEGEWRRIDIDKSWSNETTYRFAGNSYVVSSFTEDFGYSRRTNITSGRFEASLSGDVYTLVLYETNRSYIHINDQNNTIYEDNDSYEAPIVGYITFAVRLNVDPSSPCVKDEMVFENGFTYTRESCP